MSSISSVSSNNAWMQTQMGTRPTAAQQGKMAEDAFSKIDTSGKGSFDIASLTTAVNKAVASSQSQGNSNATFSATDVQTAFAKFDSDSDGKVTQQEFTSTLSQLHGHRKGQEATKSSDGSASDRAPTDVQGMQQMAGMSGMQGMPPPPPPGDGGGPRGPDVGFTADELKAKLNGSETLDSKRSALMSNVLENFSTADADGNGKVTFAEAMALEKGQSTSSSSSTTSTTEPSSTGAAKQASTANSASSEQLQQRLMRQLMKMMEAYGTNESSSPSGTSQLSLTA